MIHNRTYTIEGAAIMMDMVAVKQADLTSEIFTRWAAFIEAKPRTVEAYTKTIRQFMRWLSDRGITRPTRDDVISFREYLKEGHKAATVQNYIMAVKQFFKWTAQEGIYPNVAENVKGAKIEKGFKKDYLTSAQVGKLIKGVDRSSLKGMRDYAILSLMVTTGLRTVEVVRANVGDMRTMADFTVLYIQGKGRDEKAEYVKIDHRVEESIRAYFKARGGVKEDEPLFTSIAHRNGGKRMTTRSISRIVKDHLKEADLESDRLTAHSLRHTAATLNLLNGGTPEETRQLLRHANINTTMIYSHALERASNNSEARIAAAIFGQAG